VSTASQCGAVKEAKDFLVERIVAEAARDRMPLSEVERQMLYFTEEGGLSKPVRQVSEAFDRDYDVDEYEARIAGLVRSLLTRLNPPDQELWNDAVAKLGDGDHYLRVLIDAGSPGIAASLPSGLRPWVPGFDPGSPRPQGDLRRLIFVALALFLLFFVGMLLLFGGNARR
jgi:hypothetical protein